jgi:hypothetical protein
MLAHGKRRKGSKGDMCSAKRNVRFSPDTVAKVLFTADKNFLGLLMRFLNSDARDLIAE